MAPEATDPHESVVRADRHGRYVDRKKMPFDMGRMGWGGFKPIVEA